MTRRTLLATLAALALLALGAIAVHAAITKPDFALTVSPSSQTVTQGNSTSYNVTISRSGGYTGSITLSAAGLPAGASATWKLSNGTSSNIVPSTLSSATLKVTTSSSTAPGTYTPKVTGVSANLTHDASYTLVLQPLLVPNFTVSSVPTQVTVPDSDIAKFTLALTRSGGFDGPVSLSVSGLPRKATAAFYPATLSGGTSSSALYIDTGDTTDTGPFQLTITATGSLGTRSAVVTLILLAKQNFTITGRPASVVAPGMKTPVNLTLGNPNNYDLKITNLSLAIEGGTSVAACSGTKHFKPDQIPAASYPITLPAGATMTLSQLGLASADMPQVEMLDLATNQDACKGAKLKLDYSGLATK